MESLDLAAIKPMHSELKDHHRSFILASKVYLKAAPWSRKARTAPI